MNEPEKGRGVKQWIGLLKGDVGRRIVIACGALGVALLLVSEFLPKKAKDTTLQKLTETQSTKEYAERLEGQLTEILRRVEGVGQCAVMVTLENGVEYIYASEEKSDNDYSYDGDTSSKADKAESTVILVKTESGYEGLLVTELQPTVKGAVVVCEGGGDETVRQRVTDAVTTVLNITSKRVCVVAGTPDDDAK